MKHGSPMALIGVAVAVAAIAPVASAQASPLARSSPAKSAAAWAPVPYRNAELSVPGAWLVESPQEWSCGFRRPDGMIFSGARPKLPKGQGCGLAASLAWMLPAGHLPKGIRHRKPTEVINGIPVYRLPSGQGSVRYLVPELGVRVGASGPLARRVLATLNRSPLSIVRRRARSGGVPAGWSRHRFGGVRFATPPSWRQRREDQWATCGTGLDSGTLLLINATKPPLALPCPYQPPSAAAIAAQPGLTVVTGKYAARSVAEKYPHCQVRHGAKICLSAVTGQGGALSAVLIFSVSRPHHHAGTFFLLGLPGRGARARAIFDSIRLARR